MTGPATDAAHAPARTILDSVGRTPLLELGRLARRSGVPDRSRILAKAEFLNPGGSGKDRVALALIAAAEQRGLRPGGTIVEATSGNTGISLAIAAAVRGYHLVVVVSEKVAVEKIRLLEALGAEVVRTPVVPHGDPSHYREVARRRAQETSGAVFLDQFQAPENPEAHGATTGPELWEDATGAAGRLDAFVCGVGTGGTLTGLARYLRRQAPGVRIVLADPVGSTLAGEGPARPYLVEGIGDDAPPPLFDRSLVDAAVSVEDRESFRFALLAARCEGLIVGGSSGCHLAASVEVAKRLPPGAVVATVLPDTGRNYLTKFLDPGWCASHGLGTLLGEVDR